MSSVMTVLQRVVSKKDKLPWLTNSCDCDFQKPSHSLALRYYNYLRKVSRNILCVHYKPKEKEVNWFVI